MPPLGRYSPLDETLHPSKIALAQALRKLMPPLGSTCKALAKQLGVSETLLSHWLGGRRTPHPDELRKLWDAVEAVGADPQITWDNLLDLRSNLLDLRSHVNEHHCPCCIANQPQHQLEEPASAPIPAPEIPTQAFSAALPVPHAVGDRQRITQLPDGLGADSDLISRLRGGRQADVRFALEKAGRTLPVVEIVAIVDALKGQEQDEAAEVVLYHAARRQKKEVCELALLLNSHRRDVDLGVLLKSATLDD